MNIPTITFTPSSDNKKTGKLFIPGTCSLENLYTHPNCPSIIKETLEKHVHWQTRCETPLHRGLRLKNEFMAFRAAMAVYGTSKINEDENVTLNIGDCSTGSSMVRPTPAHTPIVGAFVRIKMEGDTIQECTISITGIEKRRLSHPNTQSIIGKRLTDDLIVSYAKLLCKEYAGYDDFNGAAEYRKEMVAVTLQRALQEANHG